MFVTQTSKEVKSKRVIEEQVLTLGGYQRKASEGSLCFNSLRISTKDDENRLVDNERRHI